MTDITISPEAEEAAARAIIIANGGDPDALLRLTIYKTTIKAWQQVAPLARAALAAGLKAWPGAFHNGHWLLFPHTKLPLTENTND